MNWRTSAPLATLYDTAAQHPHLSRLAARALWSYDIADLHRSIASQDPSALTLDIPCGGGLAARGDRHVAADLSPTMLKRARRRTRTLVQADIYALPFHPRTFDACVTYNGLHCLADPAAALRELARVLRPGGTLTGTTLVQGTTRRHDTQITLLRRLGVFGAPITTTDLTTWLTAASLTPVALTPSGAVTAFTARK